MWAAIPVLAPAAMIAVALARAWRGTFVLPRPGLRASLLWIGGALAFGFPLLVTGSAEAACLALLQATLLCGLTVAGHAFRDDQARRDLAHGIIVGLFSLSVLAAVQATGDLTGRARGLSHHPNTFAHAVVFSVIAASQLGAGGPTTALAAVVSLPAVAASGSRSAAAVWFLWLLAGVANGARRRVTTGPLVQRKRAGAIVLALFGAASLMALLLGRTPGLDRIFASVTAPPATNLLAASEFPGAAVWTALGVGIESISATDTVPRVIRLTRQAEAPWARLQQAVRLEPGTTYTFSGRVTPEGGSWPGFSGAGGENEGRTVITVAIRGMDDLFIESQGPASILWAEARPSEPGAIDLIVAFRYEGDRSINWAVGPAPDLRPITMGASATFSQLQLESGDTRSAYEPTYHSAAEGEGSIASRLRYAAFGLQGWFEAPLWGQGHEAVRPFYLRAAGSDDGPGHWHSWLIDLAFGRGLVGVLGFVLLCAAIVETARPARNWWVPFAAAMALNTIDTTLVASGTWYGLAFLAGTLGPPDRSPGSLQRP